MASEVIEREPKQAGKGVWMKFGNNKVWLVGEDSWVDGVVKVPGYLKFEDQEARLDAVSEAVTGSTIGLSGFSEEYVGNDMVRFAGSIEEFLNSADEEEEPSEIDVDSKDFLTFIAAQYGLMSVEAEHIVGSIGDKYDDEAVVRLGSGRELRCPSHPQECCYARVCIGGLELAYWHMDEWKDAPAEVMGALVGAMMGGIPNVEGG